MCSIFGVVANGRPIEPGLEEKFIRSLEHRGPDDHGVFRSQGVLIGMNRLSIIDLKTGHQPMSNEDGSLQICYNGEIYNYRELREDLIAKGYRFKTASDTEVILRSYEEYGKDCLEKLNGMFAFVIWNDLTKECFIARDRLGIKPLYYLAEKDQLIFASELKSILSAVEDAGELDRLALSRYFSFGYVPSPQTPFLNIRKLPPGHFMTYQNRDLSIRPYWNVSLRDSETHSGRDLDAEIIQISKVLEESVGMELMSDVPLGCFLSGGVDSSAVVALAQKKLGKPLHTFCFKFAEKTHDESEDAARVARHLNSIHHEIEFSREDIKESLLNISDSMDEPFADSTYLTLSLLSREVRKEVKVVLTGMGGDEVFTGYPTIRAHRYMQWYKKLPRFFRQDLISPMVNALPASAKYFSFEFKAKRFIRGQDLPPELQHFVWMEYFSLAEKKRLLGDFIPEKSIVDTYGNVIDEMDRCDSKQLINRVLHLDMKFFLENNGLFQVDRAAMAHSLEARVPLLNVNVLEKLFSIPWNLKFHKGKPKHLLKESVRNLLPASVFTKPKKGFGPPVSHWLRTFLKEILLETLSHGQLIGSPMSFETLSPMMEEHIHGKADHGRALWMALTFQLWWKKYLGVSSKHKLAFSNR